MTRRRSRRPGRRARRRTLTLILAAALLAVSGGAAATMTLRSHLASSPSRTRVARAQSPEIESPPGDPAETDMPSSAPSPRLAGTGAAPGRHVSVPILLYHYIRVNPRPADKLGFELSVTPANFAAQMALLRDEHVHTVSLADVSAALNGGPQLPPHSVVLTFDDGYDDFASVAAPTMEADGLTGTVFVVPGFLGRTSYMTAADVPSVVAMGMTVGAHTLHHVDLPHVPAEVAQAEITDSRLQLQQLSGRSVDDFAYPYGTFNAAVVAMVRRAGFRDAVTTAAGTTESSTNALTWPRLRITGDDTLASFAVKAGLPRSAAAGRPSPSPVPAPVAPLMQASLPDAEWLVKL